MVSQLGEKKRKKKETPTLKIVKFKGQTEMKNRLKQEKKKINSQLRKLPNFPPVNPTKVARNLIYKMFVIEL